MTRQYVITEDALQVDDGRLHRPGCVIALGRTYSRVRAESRIEITAPPETDDDDRYEREQLATCKVCAPEYKEVFPSSPTPRTAGEIRAYAQGYAAALIDVEEFGIENAKERLRFHSESMKLVDDLIESQPDGG